MSSPVTLGIDPSLTACGWAITDGNTLIAFGVARTKPADGDETARLAKITAAVLDGLRTCPRQVTLACVETQHAQGGDPATLRSRAASAMKVAYVAGGLTGEFTARGIPVQQVSPQEAKRALTGRGDATKQQMVAMVEARFGQKVPQDAADAVGIALAGRDKSAGRQTQAQKQRHLRPEATRGLPERVKRCIPEGQR